MMSFEKGPSVWSSTQQSPGHQSILEGKVLQFGILQGGSLARGDGTVHLRPGAVYESFSYYNFRFFYTRVLSSDWLR